MRTILLALSLLATPAWAAHVPFVGCASDGQVGPQPIPRPAATPDLPPAVAARLAYYVGPYDMRVLAPRGWQCFETYGSNGASLFVTPQRMHGTAETGLIGPAIQLSKSEGGTSGRFEVAAIAARLFPAARAFVDKVEAEGMNDKPFVRRPYPADRITHRGPYEALVTTPADQEGIGTASLLRAGSLPIDGIAILDPSGDTSLTHLAARLPTADRPLVAHIIAQVKKEK